VSLSIVNSVERFLEILLQAYTILITYDKYLTGGQLFDVCN